MSEQEIPLDFAAYFRRHNRRAVFLAFGCLVGSLAAWAAAYGILLWAEWLYLSTIHGVDAPESISIWRHFLILAVLLLAVGAWVRHWKTQNDRFHLAIALFTILSVPARLTFAIADNLRARVHPTRRELVEAWHILEEIRDEKKIPITHLPALLTSGVDAARLVHLLSITQLIDTDAYGDVYYHHLRNQAAERLVRRWSRSMNLEN